MSYDIGASATFYNVNGVERRRKYDGHPCIVVEMPDSFTNEAMGLPFGSCIVKFEDGHKMGVELEELEFLKDMTYESDIIALSHQIAASGLREGDVTFFSNVKNRAYLDKYDGQSCVIEHILTAEELLEYDFDEPKADVKFADEEVCTVSLSSLSPMTTLYSKFTDPDFIKKAKEKYNG